jgi:hypothetical protein
MQLRTAIAKQSDLFLRAGAPAYRAGCGAQRWGRQLLSIPLKCSKRSKIGLRPPSERGYRSLARIEWTGRPLVSDYERGARSTAQRNKP